LGGAFIAIAVVVGWIWWGKALEREARKNVGVCFRFD